MERTGIYYLTFSAGTTPTKYDITVQFAESAGLETVVCVPWTGGAPSEVRVNNALIGLVSNNNGDASTDEKDLLHATAGFHEYYWDGVGKLFIKTTTVLPWLGTPDVDVEGTENVIHIE